MYKDSWQTELENNFDLFPRLRIVNINTKKLVTKRTCTIYGTAFCAGNYRRYTGLNLNPTRPPLT